VEKFLFCIRVHVPPRIFSEITPARKMLVTFVFLIDVCTLDTCIQLVTYYLPLLQVAFSCVLAAGTL